MASWDGEDISLNYEDLGDKYFEKGINDFQSKNFLRGDQRFVDGIENLEQALEQYIRGDCDEKLAKVSYLLAEHYETFFIKKGKGDLHKMAKYWEFAGECNEDFSQKKEIESYNKAAYYQQSNDNFQSAAKTYQLLAQIHMEREQMNEAIEAFDRAAESFRAAGSNVHVSKLLTEKAHYLCKIGFPLEAADTFIHIIKSKVVPFDNGALGFQAMLAVLSYSSIANDDSKVEEYNQRIAKLHPSWVNSWEQRSVMKMIDGWRSDDPDKFTDAVNDYNIVSTLGPWEVDILLAVKRLLKGELTDLGPELSDDESSFDISELELGAAPKPASNKSKTYVNITPISLDGSGDVALHQSSAVLTPTHAEKVAELFQ